MLNVIYTRVSTPDQSTELQELELIAYCKSRGWTYEVYRDIISGSKLDRDGLNAVMAKARAGLVERIICYKLDRLGRSVINLAHVMQELDQHKVTVIVPSQGIDTSHSNPAGRLQVNMLMAIAEFERSMICERTEAGRKLAMARGVIFGRPKTHSIQPFQVKELVASGLSLRAAAKKLGINRRTATRYAAK
jgi:DNA invertase Pin-like site-specific DNA recombinase